MGDSAEEEFGDVVEGEDAGGEVDGERVHSDDLEREAPVWLLVEVDEEVE